MDQFWLFLGRFHPLAVHLPIGIFVLLAVLELTGLLARRPRFSQWPRLSDSQRDHILLFAALMAMATAFMGWLLARDGSYDPVLINRHRNLGLLVAALAVILVVVQRARWSRVYATLLAVTLVVITAAGHIGGEITHGSGYLTQQLPAFMRRWMGQPPVKIARPRAIPSDPRQAVIYADVIHPLLEQRCVGCHGPAKSNGQLRYDTWEQMLRGGKNGAVFKAGDASASRMIKRLHIPLDEKEHMPPKGKPQLTDDEIALLEWWIDRGASVDKKVADVEIAPAVADILETRFAPPAPPLPPRAYVLVHAAALAKKLGIIIRPMTVEGPWLEANARLQSTRFGDAQLDELAALAPVLQWLDLGETAVTDAGLGHLAGMKNLQRLHLDRTAITDTGLTRLSGLTKLEYLNLYGTAIGDPGLGALQSLPRLRSIYIWKTHATAAAAKELGKGRVDQRKIQRWRDQIADLQGKIGQERFDANLGETLPPPPPPTPPVPMAAPAPAAAGEAPAKNPAVLATQAK